MAEAEADRSREGRAPLCQMHELYEAWVASEFLRVAERRFGEPDERLVLVGEGHYGKPAYYSRWRAKLGPFEIWVQPGFNADGRVIGSMTGVRSVTSVLIPDVIIASSAGVVGADAKYTSRSTVAASTVTATGSKYLWGVRNSDDEVPTLGRVHLLTNAEPVQPFSEASLIKVYRAVPSETEAIDTIIRSYESEF